LFTPAYISRAASDTRLPLQSYRIFVGQHHDDEKPIDVVSYVY